MKVGILTHPLIGNYGGILQALAMKQTLEDMGHEVTILDRRHNLSLVSRVIKLIGKRLGIKRFSNPFHQYADQGRFIDRNFSRTRNLHSHRELVKAINKYSLDFVLIGSDQVWNLAYTRNSGLDYWGEFLKHSSVKAFSYAASMGASEWNVSADTSYKIKNYLSKFTGVSVRESHTKELLEAKLALPQVDWVLDPTMLQNADFYDKFASMRLISEPYVFVYWLGCEHLTPNISAFYRGGVKILKCKLGDPLSNLSVEDWLSAIKYAEAVVTDSFHGCAISIVYKKHFVPYVNTLGGVGRLTSLFAITGLDAKKKVAYAQEDYDQVALKIEEAQEKSKSFLIKSLSQKK